VNPLIRAISCGEYREFSGIENCPLCMATALSPNGKMKKHNLYSKQPSACKQQNQRH